MKIAICIPAYGDTRAQFTVSLARMIYQTMRGWSKAKLAGEPDIQIILASSSSLAANRAWLAEEALAWGADWLLWLDADQTFPPHALLRLLAVQRPVVAASSPRRHFDALPSATIVKDGEHVPVWTTPEKVARNDIEAVSYVGFSVFLVAAEAVRALERPLFATDKEDMYFCGKLRAAGHHVFVDHALSWDVGHLLLDELTHATALERKARREAGG